MEKKIVLITGATGGIGKAAAHALSKMGHHVIIHGRSMEKVKAVQTELIQSGSNGNIDIVVGDLFLLEDTRRLAKMIEEKYEYIDILINNAGGMMNIDRQVTAEGHEKTIALNLLAPFLLTELLLAKLQMSKQGRIINVSSNSHQLNAKPDFGDLQLEKNYNPLVAYGNSKLFLIWVTQYLAKQLKEKGSAITVNTMHPGAVASNFAVESNLGAMLNFFARIARRFFRSTEQGADTIVYLATADEVASTSGLYFVDRKPATVSTKYYSSVVEQQIWDYCSRQARWVG